MENILNQKIVLNPSYTLLQDKDRILLTYKNDSAYKYFYQSIHPMHAILFSFFDGEKKLNESIYQVSEYFSIASKVAYDLIIPFIENPKEVTIEYDGNFFTFPENLLKINLNDIKRNDIDRQTLLISEPFNFKRRRLSIPRSILFVIGTKCITDCVYCYADRKTKFTNLSLKRIISIIEDAKNIGVCNFVLSGGEIFLHNDWKEILEKLIESGYDPEISTKVPVSKKIVEVLSQIGIKKIQVSLDSVNPTILRDTLNINENYCSEMIDGIRNLNKSGIGITIKSTLTKETCTVENINGITDFIADLECVNKYTITTSGYSHYKSLDDYHSYRPTIEQIKVLESYIPSLKRNSKIPIVFDNQANLESELSNYKSFKNRSLCTANVDGFIILPDGKVTICEELYWNEDFIIGDLSTNNIMEVWESSRAISLWDLKQELFPIDSPCKICQDFINCRQGLGVCWKEVIAMYGKKNNLFPDPRCPHAPIPINAAYYNINL